MKKEKIEKVLWALGFALVLIALVISYIFPSIITLVPITVILALGALSFFYFKVKDKKFAGTLLLGYAVIILLRVVNVISTKLYVLLLIWTGIIVIAYALFFGVLSFFLIRRLRWNDKYHKKIKEEARMEREKKAKLGVKESVENK